MIVETALFATASSLVLYAQNEFSKARKDQKKIEHLFVNAQIYIEKLDNYHKRKIYPKLIRKEPIENGDTIVGIDYIYRLPIGIPFKLIQKIEHMINDTLNKEVQTKYDGILHIRVPKQPTPQKLLYEDVRGSVEGWEIPVGMSSFGMVRHDFDEIPHMTCGGLTRYGKTILLKVITTTVVLNNPETVKLHFFDLKGGLEFAKYENLKQTVSLSSDIHSSHRNLMKIKEDMENKMRYFRGMGITNITESTLKERNFVFVDEGAELTPHGDKEQRKLLQECQDALSYIARIGGALGYRLVYCTQYPTGDTLPRQIKQNADAKISFRVPTNMASRVCIDADGAEELPHALPGRAIFKTDKYQTVQVPYDPDFYKYVKQYEVNKDDEQHRIKSETGTTNSVIFE